MGIFEDTINEVRQFVQGDTFKGITNLLGIDASRLTSYVNNTIVHSIGAVGRTERTVPDGLDYSDTPTATIYIKKKQFSSFVDHWYYDLTEQDQEEFNKVLINSLRIIITRKLTALAEHEMISKAQNAISELQKIARYILRFKQPQQDQVKWQRLMSDHLKSIGELDATKTTQVGVNQLEELFAEMTLKLGQEDSDFTSWYFIKEETIQIQIDNARKNMENAQKSINILNDGIDADNKELHSLKGNKSTSAHSVIALQRSVTVGQGELQILQAELADAKIRAEIDDDSTQVQAQADILRLEGDKTKPGEIATKEATIANEQEALATATQQQAEATDKIATKQASADSKTDEVNNQKELYMQEREVFKEQIALQQTIEIFGPKTERRTDGTIEERTQFNGIMELGNVINFTTNLSLHQSGNANLVLSNPDDICTITELDIYKGFRDIMIYKYQKINSKKQDKVAEEVGQIGSWILISDVDLDPSAPIFKGARQNEKIVTYSKRFTRLKFINVETGKKLTEKQFADTVDDENRTLFTLLFNIYGSGSKGTLILEGSTSTLQTLLENFRGKMIIEPMDVVYIWASTPLANPNRSLSNEAKFVPPDSIQDDIFVDDNVNKLLKEVRNANEYQHITKNFGDLVKSNNGEMQIFQGLVEDVTHDFDAEGDQHSISVSCTDNMKWLEMSPTLSTPGLYDPQAKLNAPMIKTAQGEQAWTPTKILAIEHPVLFGNSDKDEQELDSSGRSLSQRSANVVFWDKSFASVDAANLISLLITGVPYNPVNFAISTSITGTYKISLTGQGAVIKQDPTDKSNSSSADEMREPFFNVLRRRNRQLNKFLGNFIPSTSLEYVDVEQRIINIRTIDDNLIFLKQFSEIVEKARGDEPADPKTYTVVKGDTVSGIASSLGLSVQQMLDVNQNIRSGNVIEIGQVLTLPSKAKITKSLFYNAFINEQGNNLLTTLSKSGKDTLRRLEFEDSSKNEIISIVDFIERMQKEVGPLYPLTKLQELVKIINNYGNKMTNKKSQEVNAQLIETEIDNLDNIVRYGLPASARTGNDAENLVQAAKFKLFYDLANPLRFEKRKVFIRQNRDKNFLKITSQYQDQKIEAFNKLLQFDINIWQSDYELVSTLCREVAQSIDFEFYADSQGHLNFMHPRFNRTPMDLLSINTATAEVQNAFDKALYSNVNATIKDDAAVRDVLREEIRILELKIDWIAPSLDTEAQKAQQVFIKDLNIKRAEETKISERITQIIRSNPILWTIVNPLHTYAIDDSDIYSWHLAEGQPDYTRLDVTGAPNIVDIAAAAGISTYYNAWGVHYQLWRNYGFKWDSEHRKFLHTAGQAKLYCEALLALQEGKVFTGNVTKRGDSRHRLGDVAYIRSKDMLYYIAGVQHSFTFGQQFTTTLTFSYGRRPGTYITHPFDSIGSILAEAEKQSSSTQQEVTERQTGSINTSNTVHVANILGVLSVFESTNVTLTTQGKKKLYKQLKSELASLFIESESGRNEPIRYRPEIIKISGSIKSYLPITTLILTTDSRRSLEIRMAKRSKYILDLLKGLLPSGTEDRIDFAELKAFDPRPFPKGGDEYIINAPLSNSTNKDGVIELQNIKYTLKPLVEK